MALDVEPVAQAQRPEFLLRELAGKKAAGLIAKFPHALIHQGLIDVVVAVHGARI